MGIKKNKLIKNSYMDSVFLMQTASRLEKKKNVTSASLMMGTEANKEILRNSNLLTKTGRKANANDLIIAVEVREESSLEEVFSFIHDSFNSRNTLRQNKDTSVPSLQGALNLMPDANFALISAPGVYAPYQAQQALEKGLNVMIFSDNVPLEDEIELKEKALQKGLIVMGPDCGTAIINGVPLGFANIIPGGDIGIAAASGSGLQELTVTIAKQGSGITQAIGTGGKDLSLEVGGTTMLTALKFLKEDPATRVITLLSKPPHPKIAEKILSRARETGKPVVVCFLGSEKDKYTPAGNIYFTSTIQEAAITSSRISAGEKVRLQDFTVKNIQHLIEEASEKIKGRYIRGFFAGGTLCNESIDILNSFGIHPRSNVFPGGKYLLENSNRSIGHTLIDMGEDEFTAGLPHPMIDLTLRNKRLRREASDGDTGIILLDFILGFAAHPDPAGESAEVLKKLQKGKKIVIASVCGTEDDPQDLRRQVKILTRCGVYVLPTNAQASRFAAKVLKRGELGFK